MLSFGKKSRCLSNFRPNPKQLYSAWNCRCDATEVLRTKYEKSDISQYQLPPVQPGFRTNVGKTGEIFTKDHPYFSNTPPTVAKQLSQIAEDAAAAGLPPDVEQHVAKGSTQKQRAVLDQLLRENPRLTRPEAKQLLDSVSEHIHGILATGHPHLALGGYKSIDEQYDVFRKVLKDRFKTQFDRTIKSGGVYNPPLRARVEEHMFGYEKKLDPAKRPVYGYLTTVNKNGVATQHPEWYGDLGIRLKPGVTKRATLTAGDSLNLQYVPGKTTKPGAHVFIAEGEMRQVSTKLEQLSKAKHIDDLRYNYVELQFHGGLSASAIESVAVPYLRGVPLDILEECKRLGITVIEK